MMKKFVVMLVGLIFVLSLTGFALAQEKAKPAEPAKPAEAAKPAEPAKPAEAAKPEAAKPAEPKKEAPKPVVYRMGGTIVAIDADANKVTIKQDSVKKQKKVTLSVAKNAAKFLQGLKAGDAVDVWVSGKTVTKIIKVF